MKEAQNTASMLTAEANSHSIGVLPSGAEDQSAVISINSLNPTPIAPADRVLKMFEEIVPELVDTIKRSS